jgi:dihydroflavonol-4-reductase
VGACNLAIRDFFGRLARISRVSAPWLPMPRSAKAAGFGAALVRRFAARAGLAALEAAVDPVAVEMAQCFWYLDASKATRELGWTARDPNETLYDTVEDLRARGVVWPDDERPL